MNKNNIKLISIGIIITGVLFTGCNIGLSKKTDTTSKKQAEKSKIFKAKVVGKAGEFVRGWLDATHILEVEQINLNSSSKTPKDNIYEWIQPISRAYDDFDNTVQLSDSKWISDVSISPDKNKLCFDKWGGKEADEIKDLKSGNEKKISLSTPAWSPNGRYYCGRLSGSKEKTTFLIYDTENNTEKEVEAVGVDTGVFINSIVHTNDCKHALVIAELLGNGSKSPKNPMNFYLVDIIDNKLSFKDASELQNYKIGNKFGEVLPLDDSTLLFIDTTNDNVSSGYSLYSYNINSKSTKEVLDNISYFSISPNEKYIAFTNKDGRLYLGEFNRQAITVSNVQIIYEGENSGSIYWNEDNKKMLFGSAVLELQ